ncbi:AraC family transcriptional regulator [Uliginosibacterium sediminicola]|uniref:AraC family transcriptional regulator n=1 Tax=Uliginosibacterium sediminicola TaxID=2024550 RepID=A0ABU9Z3J8_9RHOO
MMNVCTDRLEALLDHFPVRARMFHSGSLCGTTDLSAPGEGGQIHLIRSGALEAIHAAIPSLQISEPSLLLYARPTQRCFVTDTQLGADLACAQLDFEGGEANPIVSALPEIVCLPLAQIEGANPVLTLLFAEAFGSNCGKQALVDRLFEVVLIQVLRHLMETGELHSGMLAGLSHPKLRKALVAMHEEPASDWSLDALALAAGMSRTVFAETFRRVVGCTPGAYLQAWRVSLAQKALRRGAQLKMIAAQVGYGSEAALSRAFKAHSGVGPREWRQRGT